MLVKVRQKDRKAVKKDLHEIFYAGSPLGGERVGRIEDPPHVVRHDLPVLLAHLGQHVAGLEGEGLARCAGASVSSPSPSNRA